MYPLSPEYRQEAETLARDLDVPALPMGTSPVELAPGGVVVALGPDGPALQETGPGAPGPVGIGFSDPALMQRRRSGHNELLGRAVGWRAARAPAVLDGTAGFGRDAFVLADLGCEVRLCERDPLMAALLSLAISRAAVAGDAWLAAVVSRLRLEACDVTSLDLGTGAVDVIYLDPMFTAPRKTAPGKAMQALQRITGQGPGEQSDAAELLHWALRQPVPRVVVKRPRRAPPLALVAPSHTLSGRAVRFDVYQNTDARLHDDRAPPADSAPPGGDGAPGG